MSNSLDPWTLSRPEVMPKGFDGDPNRALLHMNGNPWHRHNVRKLRSSLAFFDGWRPAETALPWVERLLSYVSLAEMAGQRGPKRKPQSFLDIKAIGQAVNGTCWKAAGNPIFAEEIIMRTRRALDLSPRAHARS